MGLQTLGRLIYPAQCITCDEMIENPRGLCPSCWSKTEFITDLPCDSCGRPLEGHARPGDRCEDCHRNPPIWKQGRAALLYDGNGRKLVLKLKHGDRTDLVHPAGNWMAGAAKDIVTPEHVVAPIPMHWLRQVRRRYNQAALLSRRVAHLLELQHLPDVLKRTSSTRSLEGLNAEQRRDNVAGSMRPHAKAREKIAGRSVLLVDDVMTTGATLTEATQCLLDAGARDVSVLVLARVASWR